MISNFERDGPPYNRELTLKCKLKCYVKPMKDLMVTVDLIRLSGGRGRGSIPTEVKRIFSLPRAVS